MRCLCLRLGTVFLSHNAFRECLNRTQLPGFLQVLTNREIGISIKPLATAEIRATAQTHRLPRPLWHKTSSLEKQPPCLVGLRDKNLRGMRERKAQGVLQEGFSQPRTKTVRLHHGIARHDSVAIAGNKNPIRNLLRIGGEDPGSPRTQPAFVIANHLSKVLWLKRHDDACWSISQCGRVSLGV